MLSVLCSFLVPVLWPLHFTSQNTNNILDLDVGQIINIPTIPVSGNVTITHSNSNIASAVQNSNSIDIKGLVQGTDTITVTGVNSSGQTVSGTLTVNVRQNSTTWNNGNIFARNFQKYFPAKRYNKVSKVKNYAHFWDKKTHIVHRSNCR